jgi:hypothetical protein
MQNLAFAAMSLLQLGQRTVCHASATEAKVPASRKPQVENYISPSGEERKKCAARICSQTLRSQTEKFFAIRQAVPNRPGIEFVTGSFWASITSIISAIRFEYGEGPFGERGSARQIVATENDLQRLKSWRDDYND